MKFQGHACIMPFSPLQVDLQLQAAMTYVFGSTFVCKTIDAAKEVNLLLDAFLL